MKRKAIIFFVLFITAAACSKLNNSTGIASVIYNLRTDSTSIMADGSTLVHASVQLDSMATTDRFGVLFKINTGNFPGGPPNTADTTQVVQAQFFGQSLIANVVVQAPQIPGMLIISAQPNLPQVQNNIAYILKDTVQLRPSIPAKIVLIGSNAGIASNYGSQVTFTGSLYNNVLGKVSLGYTVSFADSLAGPVPANGYWTAVVDTTSVMSQVSAIYSIGTGVVGTPIFITCTLLDSMGKKTSVMGTTIIYINK